MKEVNKSLEKLYKELEKYKYIVEKLSNPYLSMTEIDDFVNMNKTEIQEMNIIRKKNSDIEWNQLSPEQQKDYLDKYSED
jgi:hypothetical protein